MQRRSGFTLIEMMITIAVLGILAAIAYPSYLSHVKQGYRSAGQQYLTDVAQREEQYLLDYRWYTSDPTALGMPLTSVPNEIVGKYDTTQGFTITISQQGVGVTPTYLISLKPLSGGPIASDGTLLINNLQQAWRETDGDFILEPKVNPNDPNSPGDCLWSQIQCTPTP